MQPNEVYPSLAQNHNCVEIYVEIPESHLKADIVGHQSIVADSHLSPGSFVATDPGANFRLLNISLLSGDCISYVKKALIQSVKT